MGGLYACPTTGGCASPTLIVRARTLALIPNLVADEQGVFWTEEESATSIDSKLLGCASAACPGGPKTYATGLTRVGNLRLDAKFFYFETDGATGGNSRAVKRLAR